MAFDVQSALARALADGSEKLGPGIAATTATTATNNLLSPGAVATVAIVAAAQGSKSETRQPAPSATSSGYTSNQTDPITAPGTYGFACGLPDRPKTWSGKVVSLAEWRQLSDWERDGSTGLIWNALTNQWEAAK